MTTADHNTKRARELLTMMERIRAFEEQAMSGGGARQTGTGGDSSLHRARRPARLGIMMQFQYRRYPAVDPSRPWPHVGQRGRCTGDDARIIGP